MFKRMSFKAKLILLVMLPVIGALVASSIILKQNYQTRNEMQTLTALTELSVQNSNLVHELQKERGATAGFLGSKGKKFKTELTRQRSNTDDQHRIRAAFLSNQAVVSPEINRILNAISKSLEQLASIRSRADRLSIPTKEAIGYYTKLNSQLLSVTATIANISSDTDHVRDSVAYYNFLQGKERAGIERAVLSGTFGADTFGSGMYQRFVSLVSEQQTYTASFNTFASQAWQDFSRQQMGDPAVAEVDRLRSIAHQNATNGGFGVDAEHWFKQATLRINRLKNTEDFISKELLQQTLSKASSTGVALIINLSLTLALFSLLAISVVVVLRQLSRQIASLSRTMDAVTINSDLTTRVTVDSADELGEIASSMNTMLERFSNAIGQITNSSHQLAVSAEQTSTTIALNSKTINQQRFATTQVAAAIEEMSATVQEIARNTVSAADYAKLIKEQVETGCQMVQESSVASERLCTDVNELGDRIGSLHKSSGTISNVINVINSIAEQTNLLALNAAIEAARAGEQGRGFAVVADEVRILAQRTQSSTQEIEKIIGKLQLEADSAFSVIEGNRNQANDVSTRSKEVLSKLEQVANSVFEINGVTQQIAAAAEEQVSVIEEISNNISQIDNQAMESATGAEEIAATAKSQAEMASSLQTLATAFTV